MTMRPEERVSTISTLLLTHVEKLRHGLWGCAENEYNRPDFGLLGLDTNVTTHTAQPSAGLVIRF